MRRCDPAGDPLPLDAYVFGDEIGHRVESNKRSWGTAVLRAHGHAPKFTKTGNLTPASRRALQAIDLHFHDLRREAGSRWLEGGVPIHVVRDWLGHTSIQQTSTYLGTTVKTQHDAMAAYERARADVQRFATKSKTGGRKSSRTNTTRDRRPNKTGIGHERPIM
jgi:integrase